MSIDLRTAKTYGLFAGNGVTNTGNTLVRGNLGVYPSNIVLGFPPGVVTGTIHVNNASDTNGAFIVAEEAQLDALTAYSEAIGRDVTQFTLIGEIAGLTLLPGVYDSTTINPITINGNVTLDAQGIAGAVWILKINSGLVTGANSQVVLINSANPTNVYWAVSEGLVSLGNNSLMKGTILSNSPVNVNVTIGATTGAILAINASMTTHTNNISSFSNYGVSGGDPHVLCLDGSRIDVYEEGFYRFFDNCTSGGRVVVNAEIRRDPFDQIDYYYQVWIQTQHFKTGQLTNHLIQFQDGHDHQRGLFMNDEKILRQKWTQILALDDPFHQVYQFACEAIQNTVQVATAHSYHGPMSYSGLLAGLIQPLDNLSDLSSQSSRLIESGYYDQNALLAGSHGPHIVTCHQTSLRPRHGWYRLLQWKTPTSRGVINVKFDGEGQVRHLKMLVKDMPDLTWEWLGNEHWKLEAKRNHEKINRGVVDEQEIILGHDSQILLRIQGNGSISASFRHLPPGVRGLYFGDEIEVYGEHDEFLTDQIQPLHQGTFKPIAIQTQLLASHQSLYQTFIEPDLHQTIEN